MPPAADQYLDELSCYIDVLHDNGYINSLCGKCHLGIAWTHDMVFHTGLLYRLVVGSRYNNAEMIQNGEVGIYTGYTTDIITDNAINFIR